MGISHHKGLLDTYCFLMMAKVAGSAMYIEDNIKVRNWQAEDSLGHGN